MGWIFAAFTGGFLFGGIVFGAVGFVRGYMEAVKALASLGTSALTVAAAQSLPKVSVSNSTKRGIPC